MKNNFNLDCDVQVFVPYRAKLISFFVEQCQRNKLYINSSLCPGFIACSQTCADLSEDVKCRSECEIKNNLGGCFCADGTYLQDDECVSISQCRLVRKCRKIFFW